MKLGQVYEEYAKELGKSAINLTENERRQAFLNHLIGDYMREIKWRYVEWFAEVIDKAFANGSAEVMLGDDLIGELYVDKGPKGAEPTLHWRNTGVRDHNDPRGSAPQGEDT